MVAKTIKRQKITETVKEELSKSLKENDTVEKSDFDIKSIADQKEAINKIKHYDEIIKTGNKNTIRYKSIQGQMLKKSNDSKEFVENVGVSRSTIYFKIGLYKLLKKHLALKNSIFSSHYFKNNFEMIKRVCKSNKELFTLNKNSTNGFINHYCFQLVFFVLL